MPPDPLGHITVRRFKAALRGGKHGKQAKHKEMGKRTKKKHDIFFGSFKKKKKKFV